MGLETILEKAPGTWPIPKRGRSPRFVFPHGRSTARASSCCRKFLGPIHAGMAAKPCPNSAVFNPRTPPFFPGMCFFLLLFFFFSACQALFFSRHARRFAFTNSFGSGQLGKRGETKGGAERNRQMAGGNYLFWLPTLFLMAPSISVALNLVRTPALMK